MLRFVPLRLACAVCFTVPISIVSTSTMAAASDGVPAAQLPSGRDDGESGTTPSTPRSDKEAAEEPEQGRSEPPSDADRIARLQQSLETDQQRLERLRAALVEYEAEFERAGAAFRDVDNQLQQRRGALEGTSETDDGPATDALNQELGELERRWKLARERFDLAIEQRKTVQGQIATLQQKIRDDREALDAFLNPPEPSADSGTPPVPSESPSAMSAAEQVEPTIGQPSTPAPTATPVASDSSQPAASPAKGDGEPSPELIEAQEELARTQADVQQADAAVSAIASRLETLERSISLEHQARETARKQADNAEEILATLSNDLQRKLAEGAPTEDTRGLQEDIQHIRERLQNARREVRERALHLDRLHADRAALLSDQLAAATRAAEERSKADAARQRLEAIQNPFTLRNMTQWLLAKGPRLLLIVIVALALQVLIRIVGQRIVRSITRGDSRGTKRERENRANTLVSVFQNAALVALYVGATLMMLDVVGIPIGPLLGGAAVVGLAIAFGAQNLIKDYFYGFMILMENQYCVNDVVSVGGITGFVERITLRVTVLRDLEAVHFVPHGHITTVSNLTHKWSRAVFDIGVSYHDDVDQVMRILTDLGAELRADPEFAPFILDDLEMLGVDAFGDSAVVIKFFIKTQPMKQWTIKREMLRRIKRAFDARGVTIPFPHRTLYHRYEGGTDPSPARQTGAL